jgi:hypothetical protein
MKSHGFSALAGIKFDDFNLADSGVTNILD